MTEKDLQGNYFKSIKDSEYVLKRFLNDVEQKKKVLNHKKGALLVSPSLKVSEVRRFLADIEAEGVVLALKVARNKAVIRDAVDKKIGKYDELQKLAVRNLIINLASSVEVFLMGIINAYYAQDYSRISVDKEFKLSELKDLDFDLERFLDGVVEEKARSIGYKGTKKWLSHFTEVMGFDMSSFNRHDDIYELFLVRNSFLHNGAMVTRELVLANQKYAGLLKVPLRINDYHRFKGAATALIHTVSRTQSTSVSENGFEEIMSKLDSLSREPRIVKPLQPSVKNSLVVGIARSDVNKIVMAHRFIGLTDIRKLLCNRMYESKVIATKILLLQMRGAKKQTQKDAVYKFALLNLSLFNENELVDFIARGIFDYHKTGIPVDNNFIASMASSGDVFRGQLALKIVRLNAEFMNRQFKEWVMHTCKRKCYFGDASLLARFNGLINDVKRCL